MNKLDPAKLFTRIAKDLPQHLHAHLFVTGSLAAAYHYQGELVGRAVNTKDADLVVHPAGDVDSCATMAKKLLDLGWTRTDTCFPQAASQPENDLCALRLYPPQSTEYFIEFLNLPPVGQREAKRWIPIQLEDGWYGLPSFRFMGLTGIGRLKSNVGLEYAAPCMMALHNLLSHPQVGSVRIESGEMRGTLRSAKDLGRVLALAILATRNETEKWPAPWLEGLKQCFPGDWKYWAEHAGDGLRDLLGNPSAMNEARATIDLGLLSGKNVTTTQLQGIGERLLQDAIEPLANAAP